MYFSKNRKTIEESIEETSKLASSLCESGRQFILVVWDDVTERVFLSSEINNPNDVAPFEKVLTNSEVIIDCIKYCLSSDEHN